jgi:dihydroorotate dehydrogenase electron transfer subunit
MHSAKGCIEEIYLDERRAARLACPPALIPAPGQYLLARAVTDTDSPLAFPVYRTGICPGGFYAAPRLPSAWLPGVELILRGPFGHGFSLPPAARRIALAAFGATCARLLALLEPALAQNAAVVLLTEVPPAGLPSVVEISPLSALSEAAGWTDYLALDLPRAKIQGEFKTRFQSFKPGAGQVLIETPIPCGGLADCGACAVSLSRSQPLACKEGPVFDLKTVLE